MAASSFFTSLSGLVSPGDNALLIRPSAMPATPKRGVIFVHGAGSDATYCIATYGRQSSLTRAVADSGRVCFSGDLGGPSTWGNATAMARLTAAYNYLQTLPGVLPGKVVLISGSMGGLTSLNWTAANPDKVAAVVSVIPVINPYDIVYNGRALAGTNYAPSVNSAYPPVYTETRDGATSNPRTIAQTTSKYAGIPMQLWYGKTDPLCIPAETEAFAATPGMCVELHPLPTGHEEASYSAVDPAAVVAFLDVNA